MFPNSSSALTAMSRPPIYPGQAQYFGLGQGSDGKMPCALTFTGRTKCFIFIVMTFSTI